MIAQNLLKSVLNNMQESRLVIVKKKKKTS